MKESETTLLKEDKEHTVDDSKALGNNSSTDEQEPKDRVEKYEDSLDNTTKRLKSDEEKEDDLNKRKKTNEDNKESATSDASKTEANEGEEKRSPFDILTNTKEYDCPIAKLAKMNPGNSFFYHPKADEPSTLDTVGLSTLEASEEDNNEGSQVVLESSLSESEKLLTEIKDCKLSVYKDSEWSVPIPVVTHLIVNKDTSNKRLVSFQFGTGRLLLNTVMLPSMSFKKLKNKSIIFSGQLLGDSTTMVPYRLLFTDTSNRDEFHKLFQNE